MLRVRILTVIVKKRKNNNSNKIRNRPMVRVKDNSDSKKNLKKYTY